MMSRTDWHRFIIGFSWICWLCWSPASGYAQEDECLVGDPNFGDIHRQISGQEGGNHDAFIADHVQRKIERALNNESLALLIAELDDRNNPLCSDPGVVVATSKQFELTANSLGRRWWSQPLTPIQGTPYIKRSCIRKTISNVRNIMASPKRTKQGYLKVRQRGVSCSSEHSTSAGSRKRSKKEVKGEWNSNTAGFKVYPENVTPCLTEEYVTFVADLSNQVIDCYLRSGLRVDPQVVFSKINNETKFGAHFSSVGGKGLTQLTSIAFEEMTVPSHQGYKFLMKNIDKTVPSCGPLLALMKDGDPPKPVPFDECRVIAPGAGMARSLFLGVGLQVYYRERFIVDRLKKAKLEKNPEFDRFADYSALLAFGAEGPSGAKGALNKIHDKLRRNPKLKFDEFRKLLRATKKAEYLDAIDNSMKGTFKSVDHDCRGEWVP